MVQNCTKVSKWSKTVQNGPKWSKIVKMAQIVQNGPIWFCMVLLWPNSNVLHCTLNTIFASKLTFFLVKLVLSPKICELLRKKKYFVHKNIFCVKCLRKIFQKTVCYLLVELQRWGSELEPGVSYVSTCLNTLQYIALQCSAVRVSTLFLKKESRKNYQSRTNKAKRIW